MSCRSSTVVDGIIDATLTASSRSADVDDVVAVRDLGALDVRARR